MKIESLEIRACKVNNQVASTDALAGVKRPDGLEFLVYTMTIESGKKVSTFGFAGSSAEGSALMGKASLEPFFKGRSVFDREALWHDFKKHDRYWAHLPIYMYGPADICLWLMAAELAEQPLYKYLGAFRDEVPVYCSSMFMDTAEDYVNEALDVKSQGFKAYKLHPPGNSIEDDLEIHAAVRQAVGSGFNLMSDPVALMSLPDALRYGRGLEALDFRWFEEPMGDESYHTLRELTRQLDIPVVGTEVIAKHPYTVAECIATKVVDVVRADVSWTGGVTGTMKTATLAEAFNVNCEIHTAIFHPLELVNLHLCAAVRNCTYLELLWPKAQFGFGLVDDLPIENGIAKLPQKPGMGIDLDWDLIDNSTLSVH